MKSVVIIPARYQSSRFPGKPLVPLLGKPMILWVAELSAKAVGRDSVYVATDDERIARVVEAAGFSAVMTSSAALTGTDRLAEAARQIDADLYINVQGDEPIIDPLDICKVRDLKLRNIESIINAYCWITGEENPASVNIPKVISNEQDRLVYMSRMALPGYKEAKNAPARYKKQVCIYAFTRQELDAFQAFGRKSALEACEDIEILRFLEMDKTILMVESSGGSLAVDVPEDVAPVEAALRKREGL
ncbi:3-deoxy-manno-octulosonate cytidylyltransferase [Pseudomonas nitroreducens]|uniref:3-deoxy-manno-octulosonate cytidylyltransferase n=1 Tax=Pseudomonas nitroreducens TaxID=46680 RepID=UPI002659A400|nr:3-deoxy-manno-octulosonate cytidylyltransferase [Pseudomonas nitroreducens]MCP1651921.1 3-deoxy-manno-octulosonate cytidylyltransferase (CMP-KDO synthetase) [Pseudomonas nitroreducens]MCP1689404.1 3-deoxy-manno-octulosonate cytidylyltransferase (CMP-KDO synthetase) [Pseudomonas nitroreducens]